jgi:hypothetical protein
LLAALRACKHDETVIRRQITGRSRRNRVNALATISTFAAAVFLLGAPGLADAQSSRAALIAKGAQPLTKAELREALLESEIAGLAFSGGSIKWTLYRDGSISGRYYDWMGNEAESLGKWNVNDKGQFCFQIVGSGGVYTSSRCEEWLRLGKAFYAVRDGNVAKRDVKKL